MLFLKQNPTLKDYQEYVHNIDIERGFDKENILQKSLMLGEEIGELFKAIRKEDGIGIDPNSKHFTIANELADILIFLCAIANRSNVDLEQAFRDKEEINKKRQWIKK